MDLCGDMLLDHMPRDGPLAVEASRLWPPFRRLPPGCRLSAGGTPRSTPTGCSIGWSTSPGTPARRSAVRPVPRCRPHLRPARSRPAAGRTGVYCHDLDPFRCLFGTAAEPQAAVVPAMSARILTGLRKAAVVFHSTAAVAKNQRERD